MQTVHEDRSMMPSVVRTDEGFLRGSAVVTRVGVFQYVNTDGTVRKELRHPDDVLSAESLDSLKMLPITVEHPGTLVDSTNASMFSVGQTGENYRVDGRHIVVPLTITHQSGIEAVNRGKRELSLGYRLDLVEESGTYDGEAYTHRQRNIRYNHLAIVDAARAGKAARLNLDGIKAAVLNVSITEKPMQKVSVDGIAYDAAPEVANHLAKQINRADKAEAQLAEATSLADKAEAARDEARTALDAANEKLNGAIPATEIQARVQSRVALESKVARVVALDASQFDDRQLMTQALMKRYPDIKLDGKSDDYVVARFDAMIDGLGSVDAKVAPFKPTPAAARSDAAGEERTAWLKSVESLNGWRSKQN